MERPVSATDTSIRTRVRLADGLESRGPWVVSYVRAGELGLYYGGINVHGELFIGSTVGDGWDEVVHLTLEYYKKILCYNLTQLVPQ